MGKLHFAMKNNYLRYITLRLFVTLLCWEAKCSLSPPARRCLEKEKKFCIKKKQRGVVLCKTQSTVFWIQDINETSDIKSMKTKNKAFKISIHSFSRIFKIILSFEVQRPESDFGQKTDPRHCM